MLLSTVESLEMSRLPEYDRDTVVAKATAVFWERGYGKASIGDLVRATGLNPGSLYAAFGSKKGLFLEVIDQYNLEFLEQLRALRHDERPAIDKISSLMLEIVEEQTADENKRGCLTVNALLETAQHDADIADRLCRYNQRVRDGFAALIADAQAEGSVPSRHDTRHVATFVMNNIWGMRVMCKSRPDKASMLVVIDGVMAALRSTA